MTTREKPRSTTATLEDQPPLAPLPDDVRKEETELQTIVRRTTMDAIALKDGITVQDAERMVAARLAVIQGMARMALKLTFPEDWTLWRDNEGHVVATPRASGMARVRPWFNVSVLNHRSMDGRPGEASIDEITAEEGRKVRVLEMQCDVRLGKDVLEGIPFSIRSDDKFIGRADRAKNLGGPREQDLYLCLRTGLDKKAIAFALGLLKVPEAALIEAGLDTKRCYKGSGYGSSTERSAGKVAEEGVPELAKALWDEIVRRTGGNLGEAKQVLIDITKREPDPKKKDDKGFRGLDSHERFTQAWQIKLAEKALASHEVFGDNPQGK